MRRISSLLVCAAVALTLLTAPIAASADDGAESTASTVAASSAKSLPVYRFWSSKFDNAHFYTVNTTEAQKLVSTDRNWAYEGPDFRVWQPSNGACAAGTTAVYRFWSSTFESHFFTTNRTESDTVRRTDKNWSFEGVAFCTAGSGTKDTVDVYRFWSPKFNKHFYTANKAEADKLRTTDKNWDYEGVAWRSPRTGAAAPDLRTPDQLTTERKNAVERAKSYLSFSAFSRSGLIDQLEYEGFSTKDATFAVDYLAVDWNAQAVKSAKNYIKISAFSLGSLTDQLEFEGFTAGQAKHGAQNSGANWNAEAAEAAKQYNDLFHFSRAELLDQLLHDQFTREQAEYGVRSVGL